jgi:hypothetical protein
VAIRLEFLNLIVPIKKIEKKYPGGWSQCLKDHQNAISHVAWGDNYLFRAGGAMDP